MKPSIAKAAGSFNIKNLSSANSTAGAPPTEISLINVVKQQAQMSYTLGENSGALDVKSGSNAGIYVYNKDSGVYPNWSSPRTIKNYLTVLFKNAGYIVSTSEPIDAKYVFDITWCYNNYNSSNISAAHGYPCAVSIIYKHPTNAWDYPNSMFWFGAWNVNPSSTNNMGRWLDHKNMDIVTTIHQSFMYAGTNNLVNASYAMIIRDIDQTFNWSRSRQESAELISGFKKDVYISPETYLNKSYLNQGKFYATAQDDSTMRTSFIAYTEPKSVSTFTIADNAGCSIAYVVESPETYPQWNPPTKKLVN